ncbi:DUF4124 domain-containing protein [Ferrimonas gelatinilytica]|uniref:DUF4124 domain-containing protein n=1 Tax=Ferrimonas gelatinilytica TaxID=1255257 RepID=A0ABP9S9S2_9GAMM
MRRLFLISLLFIPLCGTAQIYKWVDENGQVHYSDKPQPGAESVALSEGSTISLPSPPPVTPKPVEESGPEYKIGIRSPSEEATVRDNNGQLGLDISLEPELADGHRVQLFLDGVQVRTLGGGGSFALDNLDRGEHQLQAKVVDKNGKVLASSPLRTVYLHRHSILIPAKRPQPKPTPRGAMPK